MVYLYSAWLQLTCRWDDPAANGAWRAAAVVKWMLLSTLQPVVTEWEYAKNSITRTRCTQGQMRRRWRRCPRLCTQPKQLLYTVRSATRNFYVIANLHDWHIIICLYLWALVTYFTSYVKQTDWLLCPAAWTHLWRTIWRRRSLTECPSASGRQLQLKLSNKVAAVTRPWYVTLAISWFRCVMDERASGFQLLPQMMPVTCLSVTVLSWCR